MKTLRKYLSVLLLLSAFPFYAAAQNITVKGNVKDGSGLPVIAASVIQQGTTNGVITDADGNYQISVPANANLAFSSIGYKEQVVSVDGRNVIDIILLEDQELLEEVVVVGYGTVKKSDLTGSVSSVNIEEMQKKNPLNIGQALQGAAPGVVVSRNSGSPDGSTTIRIRGIATVQGNADPLYVIDGIISSANMVNPQDIAKIEVLKDASATAIYGSRAANGVIIITTKGGEKGKTKVDVSADFSAGSLNNVLQVGDADLFTAAVRQGKATDGKILTNKAWGEEYAGRLNTIDWQKEMTRMSLSQNYRIAASGGTETTNYMASLGYTKNQGSIINSWFERITARINASTKVRNWLTLNTNLSYFRTASHGGGNQRSYAIQIPTMDKLDENGNLMNVPIKYPDGTWGTYMHESNGDVPSGADNLVAGAYDNDSRSITDRVQGNFGATIDIVKGLTFRNVNSYYVKYNGGWDYSPRKFRTNDDVGEDSFSVNLERSSQFDTENYFNYVLDLNGHRINAMVGQSYSTTSDGWKVSGSAKDFPADNYRDIGSTLDNTTKNVSGGLSVKTVNLSYFGRLIYNYQGKYLFTGTIRRDGSSAFGYKHRWGTFPSFSAAWRINQEKFMQNVDWISNLKLRAGWGKTGSSYGDGSKAIAQISTSKMYYYFWDGKEYSEVMGAAKSKEIDTGLHWETNEQYDLGLDMGFFDNSLEITLDYFFRDSYDLLLDRNMRPSTGFTSIFTNAGRIQNKGFEFSVGYKKHFGDWDLSANFNGSTLDNKVVSIGDPIKNTKADKGYMWDDHSFTAEGYPIGSYYGYRVAGIFQTQEEIDALNKASDTGKYQSGSTMPGDYKYVDLNGDGKITDADREILGNGFAKFNYSLSINLAYKNWDFMIYGYGVAGQQILSYSAMNLNTIHSATGHYKNCLAEYLTNAWTAQNKSTQYARISMTDNNQNYRCSDAWIKNGDYFKLQNIQAGYTFRRPNKAFDNARVYVSVQNVFTVSPYLKYGDPEIGTSDLVYQGYDAGRYPYQRTYYLGLSVQF